MCDFVLFLIVCNKPHANPTIIYENIKEIHILAVGVFLEFTILNHLLLRNDYAQVRFGVIIKHCKKCTSPIKAGVSRETLVALDL